MVLNNKGYDLYFINFLLIQNWFCGMMGGMFYFFFCKLVSFPSTYFGSLLFIFWIIGWKESFILPISSPSLDPVSFHFLENFIGQLPPFPIFLFFFSTNAGLANSKLITQKWSWNSLCAYIPSFLGRPSSFTY